MTPRADLAEDERIIAGATAGPWHAVDRGVGWEVHKPGKGQCWENSLRKDCGDELNGEMKETFTEGDAAFITHSRTRYPALVAEVREFVTLLREAAEAMEPFIHLQDKGDYALGIITTGQVDKLAEVLARLRAVVKGQ